MLGYKCFMIFHSDSEQCRLSNKATCFTFFFQTEPTEMDNIPQLVTFSRVFPMKFSLDHFTESKPFPSILELIFNLGLSTMVFIIQFTPSSQPDLTLCIQVAHGEQKEMGLKGHYVNSGWHNEAIFVIIVKSMHHHYSTFQNDQKALPNSLPPTFFISQLSTPYFNHLDPKTKLSRHCYSPRKEKACNFSSTWFTLYAVIICIKKAMVVVCCVLARCS